MAYNVFGHKLSETDANGRTATWTTDYFGRTTQHVDIGGQTVTYAYDIAGQRVAQTSTRSGTPGLQQNLRYTYDAAGQLLEIRDHALDKTSTYRYDLAGNHVLERTVQGGKIYQDNHLAYDQLGQLRDVADGRVHVSFNYDKNGNRTFVGTHINVLKTAGDPSADEAHDSPRYFRSLTKVQGRHSRIRLVDRPRHYSDGGVVEHPGESGEVIRLAVLPFVQAGRAGMIECFSDQRTWHGQYADGVRLFTSMLAEGLKADYDSRKHVLVFATHLYIDGAVKSGSERQLHITDAYAAQAASVPTVSYAAFGHIHKPQRLTGPGCACYAGSPIHMDFGEEGEEKSIVLVEAAPGRPTRCQ